MRENENSLEKFFLSNSYPTGISFIDSQGGLPAGEITEICGISGSGKTNLLHQIAVASFIGTNYNRQVLYFDSDFTFDPNKIDEIAKFFSLDVNRVLNNILVNNVNDLKIFKKSIKKVDLENVSIILIDSVNSLLNIYLADFVGEEFYALKEILDFGKFLRNIVLKHNHISIIVSNQVRFSPQRIVERERMEIAFFGEWEGDYWVDEKYVPSLGSSWEEFVDNRLLLKPVRRNVRAIYVIFSSIWKEGIEVINLVKNGLIFK